MFEGIFLKLRTWYENRIVKAVTVVFVIALVIIILKSDSADEALVETASSNDVVVATPSSLSGSLELATVGSVDAKTQAKLLAEASGRVVSVNVSLGQEIAPGTIIAQLENASERAAVLQAQGAYETALAAEAQGTLGVTGAENALTATKNDAVSTHAVSYNTIAGLVATTIDDFFADPQSSVPGLRIDGGGNALAINAARVALQTTLPTWQERAATLTPSDNITVALADAAVTTDSVLALVDTLLTILNSAGRNESDSADEFNASVDSLTSARAQVLAVKSAIQKATTDLVAAEKAVAVAKLSASSPQSSNSLADAQIKQALGVLRAAEAALAKTIIRSPIGGTINNLSVRTGDYVSMNSVIAEVANNDGLEITTYLSESEARTLAIGDEVFLGNSATGTITNISPAVDSTTGKVEVRIGASSNELKTGSSVTVRIITTTESSTSTVMVPLSAVRLTTDAAAVFIVTDQGLLESMPVELGPVSGDKVTVLKGLSNDTPIVVDARGLKVGEAVTVTQ